jgi:hypothetical protein
MHFELRQRLTEEIARLELATSEQLATLHEMAQQAHDRATNSENWLKKVGGVVLIAVIMAVLKEVFVT